MRALIVLAALAASACSVETNTAQGTGDGNGYVLEVRAEEGVQTYVVTAPDGRVAAGRAADGASALLDADRAQELAALPAATAPGESDVSIRAPGFRLEVGGGQDESAAPGENETAHVSVNIGGQSVVAAAQDAPGEGEGEERAHVRITGANEASARDFINDAEDLSPEVKAQMLAAVGLD